MTWKKDIYSGGFNPFMTRFQLTKESAPPGGSAKVRAYANEVLNMSLSQAIAAFELTGSIASLNFKKYRNNGPSANAKRKTL